ncbi:MAG: hypothetical protein QM777_18710 [Pseudorhodoferax sp.]
MLHRPDAEARAWRGSGGIALARAEWVAANLRGGTRQRERQAVQQALQAMGPPP